MRELLLQNGDFAALIPFPETTMALHPSVLHGILAYMSHT